MSAVLYDIRPFQAARDQAKRLGIPSEKAAHLVAQDLKQGQNGFSVAGQLQQRAMRHERGPQPPTAA